MIGFVYLWRDRKRRMFYLGSHFGQPDDGYICSASNRFRNAYKRRPEDFKRRIIEQIHTGDTTTLRSAEQRWLNFIKQREIGVRYYNLKLTAVGFDNQTASKAGAISAAKLSPEQLAAKMQKARAGISPKHSSNRAHKFWDKLSSEQHSARNRIPWINKSSTERSAATEKARAGLSPDHYSIIGRKGAIAANANMSIEQRSANGRKGYFAIAKLSPEQLSIRARKAAAKSSPEQHSIRVRKSWANLSPEQRSARARRLNRGLNQ